jgi:ABC-type molybdate transport system permease subunit
MFKALTVIASAFLFTVLGIVASVVLVMNRPTDFQDREGVWTAIMVLLPTTGGFVAGVVVGLIAASLAPSPQTPPR